MINLRKEYKITPSLLQIRFYIYNRTFIYLQTNEQKEIVQSHHPRRFCVFICSILVLEKPPYSIRNSIIISSYVDQKFLQSYKATVGADFMEKEVVVDGKIINL
jgi:hypothetical protein